MPRRNTGYRLRYLKKRSAYYIVWTESGRSRERSTGTDDRAAAEVAFAEFLSRRAARLGPRDPSDVLVTDVLNAYALANEDQDKDLVRMSYSIRHLAKFFAGRSVQEVNRQSCREFVAFRKLKPGTVRRDLGVLSAAINHAHREGLLTKTVPVELPKSPPGRTRWLTKAEAARLLKAALAEPKVRLHLPLFILLGLYTGQRKGAILALRWDMVDLENNRINFQPLDRRVTNKRRSRIPIPRRLRTHLRNALKRGVADGPVVNLNGEVIGDIKKGFAAACARAGLKGVTPHTLRHTCATWLMQAGVNKWEAAGFLGMSMETLERVYGHHHPDHLSEAANAFSRRPRNVRATPEENASNLADRVRKTT